MEDGIWQGGDVFGEQPEWQSKWRAQHYALHSCTVFPWQAALDQASVILSITQGQLFHKCHGHHNMLAIATRADATNACADLAMIHENRDRS